jgi:hypothetical protein
VPAAEELPAVHAGHHQIQQEEVRHDGVIMQVVQSLLAVRGLRRAVAGTLEDVGEQLAVEVVVIDDQNAGGHGVASGAGPATVRSPRALPSAMQTASRYRGRMAACRPRRSRGGSY